MRAGALLPALFPAVYGLRQARDVVEAASQGGATAAVWPAAAVVTCGVAIAVIVVNLQSPWRLRWKWGIVSIPAAWFGPLAFLLVFRPEVRSEVDKVLARFGWRPAEPPAPPDSRRAPRLSLPLLVLQLVGALAAGPFVLIVVLFLAAMGGVDYLTSDFWRDILLISAAVSLGALVLVVGGYIEPRLDRSSLGTRRMQIGLALVTASLALVVGATSYLYFVGDDSPANVRAPTLAGRALVGEAVTAHPGHWSPARGLVFDYLWERCSRGVCLELEEEHDPGPGLVRAGGRRKSPRHVLKRADVGTRLRVCVVATGDWSSSPACSRPTPIVR